MSIDITAKTKRIYLAGPDVFRRDPNKKFRELKSICKLYDTIGLSPFDSEAGVDPTATEIFNANIRLIKECDVVIANLEPFRGPNVDDGTAFEIGYAHALGKRIYGYLPLPKRSLALTTIFYKLLHEFKGDGNNILFPHIEDFGYCRNLMIVDSIKSSGGEIFDSFNECVSHYTRYNSKSEPETKK